MYLLKLIQKVTLKWVIKTIYDTSMVVIFHIMACTEDLACRPKERITIF